MNLENRSLHMHQRCDLAISFDISFSCKELKADVMQNLSQEFSI